MKQKRAPVRTAPWQTTSPRRHRLPLVKQPDQRWLLAPTFLFMFLNFYLILRSHCLSIMKSFSRYEDVLYPGEQRRRRTLSRRGRVEPRLTISNTYAAEEDGEEASLMPSSETALCRPRWGRRQQGPESASSLYCGPCWRECERRRRREEREREGER